jgi:hypothetical protein
MKGGSVKRIAIGASLIGPAMRVNRNHRFHGDFRSANGRKRLRIRGRLRDNDQKARGTLRVTGDFGGSSTNCDTGRTRWRARHGN